MDYKEVKEIKNGIKITGVKNFNPVHIFECGQCFRWEKQEDNSYIGVAMNKVIKVYMENRDVYIENTTIDDFYNIWEEYFDFKRDYDEVKTSLKVDPVLKKAVDFGSGIRILNQEPFEIIISFIISSNNRIPMIKKVIKNISEKWGEEIYFNDKKYYTFPSKERLKCASVEELRACSSGFRAEYIEKTVKAICAADESLEEVACSKEAFNIEDALECDDEKCHIELQKLTGIGPKVADCIMLFSMEKYSAFPVDVWVKRAMQHFYLAPDVSLKKIREFGRNKFGDLSGFAQQYLFYYARENNIVE